MKRRLNIIVAVGIALMPVASPARAGLAEQSLYRANAKVQAAIVHDVCDVHWPEKRDQLDAADRAAYVSVIKDLQLALDFSRDAGAMTKAFCEWGRSLQKPRPSRRSPLSEVSAESGFSAPPPAPPVRRGVPAGTTRAELERQRRDMEGAR